MANSELKNYYGRLYTQPELDEELKAAIAATRMEDAELLHKRGHDRAMLIIEESITPEQRSALDAVIAATRREDAALCERYKHTDAHGGTLAGWILALITPEQQFALEKHDAAGLKTDTSGQSTQGEGRKESGR